jgi:uncharacterized protein
MAYKNVENTILLIFIKNPQLGKVKTRIACTTNDAFALSIYQQLLQTTLENTLKVNHTRWLFYSDFIEKKDNWNEGFFSKKLQNEGDLGQRMEIAFQSAFDSKASKVVIIGSDCPDLSPDIINEAFFQLNSNDFVLGPTFDGGYYLLGMNAFHAEVFRNMAWSTDIVFSTTCRIIQQLDKSVALMPMLNDIDTEADWQRWKSKLK